MSNQIRQQYLLDTSFLKRVSSTNNGTYTDEFFQYSKPNTPNRFFFVRTYILNYQAIIKEKTLPDKFISLYNNHSKIFERAIEILPHYPIPSDDRFKNFEFSYEKEILEPWEIASYFPIDFDLTKFNSFYYISFKNKYKKIDSMQYNLDDHGFPFEGLLPANIFSFDNNGNCVLGVPPKSSLERELLKIKAMGATLLPSLDIDYFSY